MNLYGFVGNNPVNTFDPMGLKARFNIQGCTITITLDIVLYPQNKRVERYIDWDWLLPRVKNSIERHWSGKSVDGCYVNVAASVRADRKSTTFLGAKGDNEIQVVNREGRFRSYVIISPFNMGTWNQNAMSWSYAHEAGHLMGLDDNYHDVRPWYDFWSEARTAPDAGHEGEMMAEFGGRVSYWELRELLKKNKVECPCECTKKYHDFWFNWPDSIANEQSS
jgi:hypothetical protein